MNRDELQTLKVAELRVLAKEKGIPKIKTLKKEELIDLLAEPEKPKRKKAAPKKKETVEKPKRTKKAKEEPITEEMPEEIPAEVPAVEETEVSAPEEVVEEPKEETAEPVQKPLKEYEENIAGRLDVIGEFGFLRVNAEKPSDEDVYVSPNLIRRFHLKTGDIIGGHYRKKRGRERYDALTRVMHINDEEVVVETAKPIAEPQENAEAKKPEEGAAVEAVAEEPVYEENAIGVLDIMDDGYGFIRTGNIMGSSEDVYVSPSLIRRFRLRTGDRIGGNRRAKKGEENYDALTRVMHVNGQEPTSTYGRPQFEQLTPIFPKDRIVLERVGESLTMRVMDLISPIGKGQRGLIVSPPKAGKTTILKDLAVSVLRSDPKIHLIILLIDERPEEVTDIQETIKGDNVEIIYSTFDELPEKHRKVAEVTLEHAKRMVESGVDVVILLDSITRLARACNLTETSSGRTLSGGLDPSALYMPKRLFGAARNTREKGSLTILATALVETGSKMDDVIYEEFKGTGNMELVLSRKLQERRIFPAIDISRSGTRREDLLLSQREIEAENIIRRIQSTSLRDDTIDRLLDALVHNRTNAELIEKIIVEKSL